MNAYTCHKREPMHYPTKSLRVWSLAPIMKRLGFQISAATDVVRSEEQYAYASDPNQYIAEWPELFLVTVK